MIITWSSDDIYIDSCKPQVIACLEVVFLSRNGIKLDKRDATTVKIT